MSRTYLSLIAPLDPYFKPTWEMVNQIFNFMLEKNLIFEPNEHHNYGSQEPTYNPIHLTKIDLFPENLKIPQPDQWTKETVSWFNNILDFDFEDYYIDIDKLRKQREPVPGSQNDFTFTWDNEYLHYNDLYLLAPYFNSRYYLNLYLPQHPNLTENIQLLGYTPSYPMVIARYGFHIEENIGVTIKNENYFKCFPYAPKSLHAELNEKKRPLLSYAGSFSIATAMSYTPIFHTSRDRIASEEEMMENIHNFKNKCIFYTILKPKLEDIFQQPVNLFVGAWY